MNPQKRASEYRFSKRLFRSEFDPKPAEWDKPGSLSVHEHVIQEQDLIVYQPMLKLAVETA